MTKEEHPYLRHFDTSKSWKYLIIGTFPPKRGCPERTDLFPYFYGNEGSLWQILYQTGLYPDFDFASVENIISWQDAYSVGVTDVLKQCTRKAGKECSPNDKDLLVDLATDLNETLKSYVLNNIASIEKIFFTSGSETSGSNSAFWFFQQLLGAEMNIIPLSKIVKLPSPSGNANTSLFKGNGEKFGLVDDFYNFLSNFYPDALEYATATWKQKSILPKGEKIQRLPNDRKYTQEFKKWMYQNYLPKQKIAA